MNFQAILVANLTGFVLIIFLHFSKFISRTKNDTEEHAFDWMMRLAALACLVEPLTFAVDGIHNPVAYWTNLLGNTYLYYANGLGSFLWLMYMDLKLFHDRSRLKKIYYKLCIPVSCLLLSLIVNIWFGYYFYVDENFVYHRQPAVYIFYIYMMLCAVYSIGLYYYYKHVYGKIAFFPVFMYLVPIVVCSVLQMLFYGISLAWLGTAIGIVALFMSLQQQRAYQDQLTGLLNRSYLEHMLFKIRNSSMSDYYGIMIDLNFFKQINDEYGHSAGDQALVDAAGIIHNVVGKQGMAFRYAGDEFIILMRTDQEADVIALEEELRRRAEEFNRNHHRPYVLSYAMGHDTYEEWSDNTDRFLKKIDEAMYADKRRCHEAMVESQD